jgi:hypothetical protein
VRKEDRQIGRVGEDRLGHRERELNVDALLHWRAVRAPCPQEWRGSSRFRLASGPCLAHRLGLRHSDRGHGGRSSCAPERDRLPERQFANRHELQGAYSTGWMLIRVTTSGAGADSQRRSLGQSQTAPLAGVDSTAIYCQTAGVARYRGVCRRTRNPPETLAIAAFRGVWFGLPGFLRSERSQVRILPGA